MKKISASYCLKAPLFGWIRVLFLLIVVSSAFIPYVVSASNERSNDGLRISVWTEKEDYLAGEEINFSIVVENHNKKLVDLSVLRFQVVFGSLNIPVLKDEIRWRRSIGPGETYSSSKVFSLPDYAPPGRYSIEAYIISGEGDAFGPAKAEITVDANYLGLAKALGILLFYILAVLILFFLIYYSRRPEVKKG
ncbi:MAG: hypothetical protein V3U19_07765 [Thermodesulfobacteriota bacterium]